MENVNFRLWEFQLLKPSTNNYTEVMSKNSKSVPVKKEFIMEKLMDRFFCFVFFVAAPAGAAMMGNIQQVKFLLIC